MYERIYLDEQIKDLVKQDTSCELVIVDIDDGHTFTDPDWFFKPAFMYWEDVLFFREESDKNYLVVKKDV